MTASDPSARVPAHIGSLSRRMMLIAAGWIVVLLSLGGFALDRTLTGLVSRNFDEQLEYVMNAMIASAEIGPDGEVFFNRPLGDQRFLEPNSGRYWLVTGSGHENFPSRSLWDLSLELKHDHFDKAPHLYDNFQYPDEPLRVIERTVILPDSATRWKFAVAASREDLDQQITRILSLIHI